MQIFGSHGSAESAALAYKNNTNKMIRGVTALEEDIFNCFVHFATETFL